MVNQDKFIAACEKGHVEDIQNLMFAEGVDVNGVFEGGWTPLHLVCARKHRDAVELLLSHPKINVNQGGGYHYNNTPLHIACFSGSKAIVDLLLEHPNIIVNQLNKSAQTPLYFACSNKHTEIINQLLMHPGITVNQADSDNET